ncbi:MAG: hypothetical protein RLZZ292_2033, partial [Bacteroidota bacterium]
MERKKIIIKPKENASSTPQTTPSKPTVTPQVTPPKPAPKKTNWDIG